MIRTRDVRFTDDLYHPHDIDFGLLYSTHADAIIGELQISST